jgi:probable rRNA maturation factor
MLQIRGAMPFGLKPSLFERLYELTLDPEGRKEAPDAGLQFVSSVKIAHINSQYAGKNSPTDVLSFETDQEGSLGDVVICSRIAQSQAVSHGVGIESELGLLFVHGLLHLLGDDHQTPSETQKMRDKQAKILHTADLESPSYP